MKSERISPQQRYDCLRTALRGSFPCTRITSTESWLSTISHEIKNPLTTILVGATLLSKNPTNEELVKKLSQSIIRSGEAMRTVIEELLDLSRLDGGTCSLKKEWIDGRVIAERVSERQMPIALSRGTALMVNLEGSIFCDSDRLTQALINLVGNALKFTEQGKVMVIGSEREGRYIISVEDTGIGISDDDLPHVFDRFWQAQTKQQAAGNGLGLAIVKGIADAHGAVVRVNSSQRKGTTFTLDLPSPIKEKQPAA